MSRKILLLLTIVTLLAALSAPPAFAAKGGVTVPADTIFKNAYVYTVDPELSVAQAVAVRDGRIVFIGADRNPVFAKLTGPMTRMIDLHGKMVMPGLQDGHTHLARFIVCNMGYEGGTEDYVLGKLKAALLREDQLPMLKSNYLFVANYFNSQSMLPAGTHLTRYMLDRLSKDPSEDPMGTGTTRPIRVTDLDGHTYIVNSKAIENSGVTAQTPDPPDGTIGRDENGVPNGFFADYTPPFPYGDPAPRPANADYVARLLSIQDYNQKGTTSIWRSGGYNADNPATELDIWKQMADNGKLTIRVNQAIGAGWIRGEDDPAVIQEYLDSIDGLRAQYDGYSAAGSPGTLTVDSVKVFADGVVEYPSQTAAMLAPYNINVGTYEDPIWIPGTSRGEEPSIADATLGFTMLDAAGWSIHVHAIGDRGVRETLDNVEIAQETNGVWDARHTIVHVEFVDPADMPRFGALGVVPNFQLQWAERDTYTVDAVEGYLSQAVLDTIYPARSLMLGGAVLAGGSDYPVDALNPWREIEQAVSRSQPANELMGIYDGVLTPWECLTLPEAIRMHTMGSAYQMHQDDVTGSIEMNKYADLIVLDRNLFDIPVDEISETEVLLTMVNGEVVWEDPDSGL